MRNLNYLLSNDAIRLQLVQLVRAADVVGIQCRIEEVTQILYHWASDTKFSEGAGAAAAESRWESTGLDEL